MSSSEAEVLVVGGALQRHDLQVLVVVDGAMEELQLRTRLAFEVQDLLGAIADVDERLALVVLRHQLAGPRRDAETEHARAGVRRREAHAHGGRLAVDRQLHLLRPDDAALVFDVERHRLAGVAGLRDERVHHQRRALERGRRRRHAIDLDVLGQRFPAEADREDRNVGRLHGQQRVRQLGVGRVGAVGHEHESRQRQAGELLPRAIERRAELRLRARKREFRRRRQALSGRGEAEAPQNEPARQRLEDVAVGGREMLLHERAARLAVDVRNLHAPRVVDEHAEEVLLGYGGLHDQHGPEEAEQDDEQRREPDGHQDRAVTRVAFATGAAIRPDRQRDRGDDDGGGNVRAGRGHEAELALLKDDRPVIEQQPKETIEHACPPWQEIEPAQAWIV